MSKLLEYRKKKNITQKELSDKSGVSIRTIQRIEAGSPPKGFTLKALSKALEISETDLVREKSDNGSKDLYYLKWINLSSLFFFIPLLHILLPFVLKKKWNQNNSIAGQIISIQILWSIISTILIGVIPFLIRWFGISRQILLPAILLAALVNIFIILRNAVELQKKQELYIRLNFSFL
ncbi:helix-turn-helix domain-containing protein [Christiangramia sabulilitoris]|uniref:Helix-turn-helix transcriptional regulator n=1 Tax=Christiangramia sabulilitoris TaxID=2583991 RepID=A0A550I7A2_9FLAO|nr:helix-turn-helix transcriptional regulator [Christiangramia sabulilitoris]TRO66831.1 helix-turn-helix transcriptional regulator [Christiangramia sabulilitoris]